MPMKQPERANPDRQHASDCQGLGRNGNLEMMAFLFGVMIIFWNRVEGWSLDFVNRIKPADVRTLTAEMVNLMLHAFYLNNEVY